MHDAHVLEPSGRDRVRLATIQSNVHASEHFKKHVNCWDFRDSGSDTSWLAQIRSGDRIQIVPKAYFTGWMNTIKEARIEVWAAVKPIDRLDLSLHRQTSLPIYRQLHHESKEIRLVIIEPARSFDDPIQLTLHHTSLNNSEHMKYDALSYCWGDPSDQESITMAVAPSAGASMTMRVLKNLSTALKYLRTSNSQRTYWIDSLCINQSNNSERNQQVALMGEIFDCADEVHVWLGEEDHSTHEDIQLIREVGQYYSTSSKNFDANRDKLGEGVSTMGVNVPDVKKTHKIISRNTLTSIFQRPWFKRVWVLQEVWSHPSRNPKNIIVRCGATEVSWEAVLQANYCICRYQPYSDTMIMPAAWSQLFQVKRNIEPSMVATISVGWLDILSILISGLDMNASDPRDKIFALFAFGEETHALSGLPDLARPDYTKDELKVFTDFTRWWIEKYRSLRILSAVHTQPGRTWLDLAGLQPSGHDIFDLSCRPSWVIWHDGRSEWAYGSLALDKNCEYNACGDKEVEIEVLKSSPCNSILNLKGMRLGTISSISYCTIGHILSDPHLMGAYERIFDSSGDRGIWRLYKRPQSITSMSSASLDFQTFWDQNAEHHFAHWGSEEMRATYGVESNDPLDHWFPCHGKVLLQTDNGQIGLCPSGAREGDLVAILYGGRVPYILRPKNDGEFYFIGECFLRGFMSGEAFTEASTTRIKEIFTLV